MSNNESSFLPQKTNDEKRSLNLWFRISRIYNYSIRESNMHLRNWNLSAAQFDVLVQVGTHEHMSQQELADKLFVTKGNIAQLIKKMEDIGWIYRVKEKKTNVLALTPVGRQLYNEVVPVQEDFQAAQFSGLTSDEKKTLLHLLGKVQRNMQ